MEGEFLNGVSLPSGTDGGNEKAPPVKYTEIFEQLLPYYLSIGMTYEQFYNEDCCLVKAYRKAQELRDERLNQQLWLQGMYFYEALGDIAPLLHAFAKEGTKATPYSDRPYPRTIEEMERREEEKRRKEYELNKEKFVTLVEHLNDNKNNKQEVANNGK